MNLTATTPGKPVPNPVNITPKAEVKIAAASPEATQEAKADDQGFQPVPAQTETFEKTKKPDDDSGWTINLKRKTVKNAKIGAGVGAAGGAGLGFFLLGPWGAAAALAAGAAVGGGAGAAVSTETAANLWTKTKGLYTGFKEGRAKAAEAKRLEEESAHKAAVLFEKKIEDTAVQRFEARWEKEGAKLVDMRVDQRLESRINSEVNKAVSERFEEKLDAAASKKFEAKWSKEGSKLVKAEVDERIESRLADEIDGALDAEVEKRYDSALESGVKKEMESRQGDLEAEIEAQVQERLAELAAERIEELEEVTAASQSLETHQELAFDKDFKIAIAHLSDGLEVFTADTEVHAADLALAKKALAGGENDEKASYYQLDQTVDVLKLSTGVEPGALNPWNYLDSTRSNEDGSYRADVAVFKSGLEVMLEHGELEAGQKVLCQNALKRVDDIADTKDKATYLDGVFSALSGED